MPSVPLQDARDEVAMANRVLVNRGILDAFGHVSLRHPESASHFLLSRSLAPGAVTAADVQVIDDHGDASDGRPSYLERFIHSEIYRARPDVQAIVHSHSASMIPFSVSTTPLRAIWHMAGFLGEAVPVFDIRDAAGSETDLLVSNPELGAALAASLGDAAVVLMRGHGYVAVGDSIAQAVARAVYSDLNARAQAAAATLGGYTALTAAEGRRAAASNDGQLSRAWQEWVREVGVSPDVSSEAASV